MLLDLRRIPRAIAIRAETPALAAGTLRHTAGRLLERRGRVGRLMKVFVFLPTLLLFLYLALIHSDMYLSRSMFAVRSSGARPALEGGLGSLLSLLPGGNAGSDSQVIMAYINSGHILERVGEEVDLQAHYGDRSKDVWSRLRRNPSRENLLKYWQWMVKASYDLEKGIISVEVKAYDRETAVEVNRAVLKHSELLVNSMNRRVNEDALRLAVQERGRAETRVAEAAGALRNFRETRAMLDPLATAQGLEKVVAELEAEAARSGAELEAALRIMRPDSLGVLEIQTRLQALQAQIENEKARLAGLDAGKGPLSGLVADYAGLRMEEEFANRQLVAAMSLYEAARVQSSMQSLYIVPIQPPTLAEESEYPRLFLFTLLGFIAFLTALGLISLTLAAVNDHLGV